MLIFIDSTSSTMLFGNNHAAGMLLSAMLYDMPDGVLYDMSLSSARVYYDVLHAYLCDIGFFNLDRLHCFGFHVSLLFTNVITAVLSMLLRIASLLSVACVLRGCSAMLLHDSLYNSGVPNLLLYMLRYGVLLDLPYGLLPIYRSV
jgi:hypothetical protein